MSAPEPIPLPDFPTGPSTSSTLPTPIAHRRASHRLQAYLSPVVLLDLVCLVLFLGPLKHNRPMNAVVCAGQLGWTLWVLVAEGRYVYVYADLMLSVWCHDYVRIAGIRGTYEVRRRNG